jgi:hypothetical protein
MNRAQRNNPVYNSPKAHDLLQKIFQTLFVFPSAAKGLLGDPQHLSFIADGSHVVTGAHTFGKFLCEWHKKGIWKCD